MDRPGSHALRQCASCLVAAAQGVLDAWQQGEDGMDDLLGTGGACQDIASAMGYVLQDIGVEEMTEVFTELDGGHVFLVANLSDGVFRIDIPAQLYESGAGYAWRKKEGVRLLPEDLVLDRIEGPIQDCDFRHRYCEDSGDCLSP